MVFTLSEASVQTGTYNKPSTDVLVLVSYLYTFPIGLVKQLIKYTQGCRNIHYRHFDGFYKSENTAGSWKTCQRRD